MKTNELVSWFFVNFMLIQRKHHFRSIYKSEENQQKKYFIPFAIVLVFFKKNFFQTFTLIKFEDSCNVGKSYTRLFIIKKIITTNSQRYIKILGISFVQKPKNRNQNITSICRAFFLRFWFSFFGFTLIQKIQS